MTSNTQFGTPPHRREWECPNCEYEWPDQAGRVDTSDGPKCIMCDRDRITP